MKKILLMFNLSSALAISVGASSQIISTTNKNLKVEPKKVIKRDVNYGFYDKYYVALKDRSEEHRTYYLDNNISLQKFTNEYQYVNFTNSIVRLTNLSTYESKENKFTLPPVSTRLIDSEASCFDVDISNGHFRLYLVRDVAGYICLQWYFYRDIFTAAVKLEISLQQIEFIAY